MSILDILFGKKQEKGIVKVTTWQTEYGKGRRPQLQNKDEEEVIGSEKIERKEGWGYLVGLDGYVWRFDMKSKKKEKIGAEKINRKSGYIYFLNVEGYVARKEITAHKQFANKVSSTKVNKKYKLLEKDTIKPYQAYPIILFRIEAKSEFGTVKKGDKGGYIQKEDNLSAAGNAWIYDNARVEGDARVSDNAQVYGSANVSECAQVYGNAKVYENAQVYGDAQIKDNAQVYGSAKVKGNALIYGNAKIYAKGWVGFNQKIGGNQEIIRDIMLDEMQ